ncbi:MAG: hypothetical protein NC818_01415 [Candidatus Omnitrophica bacterium]|nr:hypothetical protein [Candidatus Omnitrophota bacterium]
MFQNKKLILISLILGAIFSFFYNYFVIGDFKGFKLKLKDVKGITQFNLPEKDIYILKVWGKDSPQEVYFNDKILSHFYFRKRGELKELYFSLPEDLVNEGSNKIKIVSPLSYSLRIRNHLGTADYGTVLFKESKFLKEKRFNFRKFLLGIVLFSLSIFFIFRFFSFLTKNLLIIILSYIPCFLFFLFSFFISQFSPYRIILHIYSFLGMSIFLVGIIMVPLFLIFSARKIDIKLLKENFQKDKDLFLSNRIVYWIMTREFSDKCILTFMFLLILCAFLLIFKLEPVAEQIANLAYLVLVLGVGIKFVKFIREEKQKE